MFVGDKPKYGKDYFPGCHGFTMQPGKFTTHNIAMATARDKYQEHRLVATHTFIVTGENEIVEAVVPYVTIAQLLPLFDDYGVLVWFEAPRGHTPKSLNATVDLAYAAAEQRVKYDTAGLFGFTLVSEKGRGEKPNFMENSSRYFCSEMGATIYRDTASLMASNAAMNIFRNLHPSWWSPYLLASHPLLWEPR